MGVRPSIDELQRRIQYNPDTGALSWRAEPCRGKRVGDLLSAHDSDGYLYTHVNGWTTSIHRLVWIVATGERPLEVDHINCDRTDNRWINLREATDSQNAQNRQLVANASGLKGAHMQNGRWCSRIRIGSGRLFLGYTASAIEAHEMYKKAAIKHFGDFARMK